LPEINPELIVFQAESSKIMTPVGYQWLSCTFNTAPVQPWIVRSEIGGPRSTFREGDLRREVYPEAYRPAATLSGHLAFAFKYEGVHLEFLARLFRLSEVRHALEQWIGRESTGAYARRAGFLYEWLMPDRLAVSGVTRGNYVNALDPEQYVVGAAINCPRWRVRDNLLGYRDYCPMIRRVAAVQAAEQFDLPARLAELETDFGIDLMMRSAVWLTVKESRASFLIEREQNREDRIRRFAAVMESECGQHAEPLAPETLTLLQQAILGATALRYGIRRSPVYVGHAVRYQPVVDYIAPHWNQVNALLAGLAGFLDRTRGGSPIVRAATAAFGFVYIHPMVDGNGRISRFLINEVLRRDGATPPPIILPVSATITNSARDRAAYDQALEGFSRPLMRHYAEQYYFGATATAEDGIEYNLYFDGYDDALPVWRYPDFTAQVVYLAGVIDATLTREMRNEAGFLRANDRARTAIKDFLEAPDHELDGIIRSVRENGSAISNHLRKRYPRLAEQPELSECIVEAIATAFWGR
jgi:hypothetical protein